MAASKSLDDGPERIARLIADLDSSEFATREKASEELARLGRRAEEVLKRALQDSPSAEAKKRIEVLLRELGKPRLWPERLQAERSLEVLEWIGTAEARQALKELGQQAKSAWLKTTIAQSLSRLGKS